MSLIVSLLVFLACLCAATAGVFNETADLGSEIYFASNSVENVVEYVKRRNLLLARGKPVDELPAWRGRFNPKFGKSFLAPVVTANICKKGKKCKTNIGTYPYDSYTKDPTGDTDEPVMKIGYPKGSWSPGSTNPGGILFFVYPYKKDMYTKDNPLSVDSATLEFDVYFPPDFDFVKGGKLLGMAGGRSNGRGCGGGADPSKCFSVRMMWRSEGYGETYIYAPEGKQGKDFCSYYPHCGGRGRGPVPCNVCNLAKGTSFGRGSFTFKRGEWQRIRLSLVLNDPDRANGYLELQVDGKTVISYPRMRWRTSSKVKIEAIDFASWFGGSNPSWSPPKDTYVLLKNLKVYRTGPPTITTNNGRAVIMSEEEAPTEATIVYEEIQEPEDPEEDY